jgi:hypothetical protein
MKSVHITAVLLGFTVGAASACSCESTSVMQLEPHIEVVPSPLNLGHIVEGAKISGTLSIKNTGSVALTLSSVVLSGDTAFTLTSTAPSALAPSGEVSLTIVALPKQVGDLHAQLRIASDDPMHPNVTVLIQLTADPQPPCDDGNDCTDDVYDPDAMVCKHTFADGKDCSPADKCILNAHCSQGVCLGEEKVCDDHSPCTQDTCRQTDGVCVYLPDPSGCDDNNPCTLDSCGPNGCIHDPVISGTACDDGDPCTTSDSCFQGRCMGVGVTEGSACDPGDSCVVNATCQAGHCLGTSLVATATEGSPIFDHHLQQWNGAYLHRREVSLSQDGVFIGLDHLPIPNPNNDPNGGGLIHVAFTVKQCGGEDYQFSYHPPDSFVLVAYVRREMQLKPDGTLRLTVGVRQRAEDGYEPQTTAYLIDPNGLVQESQIQIVGGETGRSLLADGSDIYGTVWPVTHGPPTMDMPTRSTLKIVREDRLGNILWRHERDALDWGEFLGAAGPRVVFAANNSLGALDFNTGQAVWLQPFAYVAKEMALSTNLNLGVARVAAMAGGELQLLGIEVIGGNQVFLYPPQEDATYVPRTDPVISADGRVLVLMELRTMTSTQTLSTGLAWVELSPAGVELSRTMLPYAFPVPGNFGAVAAEEDSYPTVADDGVAYIGFGDHFWAIDPGGHIRWTITSTIPSAFTGTVPLLRDDGVVLISQGNRLIRGIKTNGGKMSTSGWASFRHDGRRTKFTP